MITIEDRYKQELEEEKKFSKFLKEGKVVSFKNLCSVLWYKYEIFQVHNLYKNNIEAFKQNAFVCGLLDEYSIKHFNSRLLDYALNHITYVLLSDNEALIKRYAELRYNKDEHTDFDMNNMVDV